MSQVKNEVAFAESEAIRTEDPCYVLGTILRILLLPVGLAAGAAVVGFSAHPFTVFRTNPTPDPGRNPWPKYFKMRATYSMIASGALALFLNSVALVALTIRSAFAAITAIAAIPSVCSHFSVRL